MADRNEHVKAFKNEVIIMNKLIFKCKFEVYIINFNIKQSLLQYW